MFDPVGQPTPAAAAHPTVRNQRRQGTARPAIQERFLQFHADHPEVLEQIVRLAEQARGAGRTKTSMKAIFEVIRWNRHVERGAEPFKLNNCFTSRYARLVSEARPDLAGMFEVRELRSA
jgi:hypothetical protein